MKRLFMIGRKNPQQTLYKYDEARDCWVSETPRLSKADRAELEAFWPQMEPVTMTEAECVAWFEERFRQRKIAKGE